MNPVAPMTPIGPLLRRLALLIALLQAVVAQAELPPALARQLADAGIPADALG